MAGQFAIECVAEESKRACRVARKVLSPRSDQPFEQGSAGMVRREV